MNDNNNLTKKYFDSRNKKIQTDSSLRQKLAEREIYTLNFLLKNFYNDELRPGYNILDVGSGDKFLKESLEKNNCNYFSLDIDDLNFEKDNFSFEKEKFDIVICLAVIEHLSDPSIFLNEIKRVLKKNRYLYISTPNWIYCKNDFYNDPTHKKPYTPSSLENILEINNFNNIKTFPNLRCKPKWWYTGKFRFFKAKYFLPFAKRNSFIPEFMSGKAKGIFALSKK